MGKNKDVLVGQHLELLLKHQNMQNKEKQHHFIILEQKRCQFLFCLILSKVFELFAKHVKINKGIFSIFLHNLKTRNFTNNADVTRNKHKHYIYIVSKIRYIRLFL